MGFGATGAARRGCWRKGNAVNKSSGFYLIPGTSEVVPKHEPPGEQGVDAHLWRSGRYDIAAGAGDGRRHFPRSSVVRDFSSPKKRSESFSNGKRPLDSAKESFTWPNKTRKSIINAFVVFAKLKKTCNVLRKRFTVNHIKMKIKEVTVIP